MDIQFRCDCPVTSALDILGDKWMLVIVKQMILDGKVTFKDFMESDEAVSSNILTIKLRLLQELGIVGQTRLPNNKKTKLYYLTDKGLDLTPMVVELALWSDRYLRELNPIIRNDPEFALMRSDKVAFSQALRQQYETKRATMLSSD